DPENTVVLVSCLDPIVRRPGGSDDAEAAAESEREQRGQARPGAVPMNIGPQPVWRTTPTRPTAAPPLPPPPTAPSVSRPPGSAEPAGSAQPAVPDTPDTAEGERGWFRSEEHTSELQSRENLVC